MVSTYANVCREATRSKPIRRTYTVRGHPVTFEHYASLELEKQKAAEIAAFLLEEEEKAAKARLAVIVPFRRFFEFPYEIHQNVAVPEVHGRCLLAWRTARTAHLRSVMQSRPSACSYYTLTCEYDKMGRGRRGNNARNALCHQQDLVQRLSALMVQVEHIAPGLTDEVRLAQADARVISKYFSETMPTKLYNERRPPHATDVAARAFAIPEILEMILSELNRSELLRSQLVTQQFRDTINLSPTLGPVLKPPKIKVKKKNAPRINIEGHIDGVKWRRRCRLCRPLRHERHSRCHPHCAKEVWAQFQDCDKLVPMRCRSLQICEPPHL
ncbi:uncharacterized protein MYCFIDRAFT_200470 [Pseudocercospora fijiensis CIRAD86]|uniref:F-box domain-containing protein n=1 Tax=Pseudocercospora fijiensis (strain CIRAD86) TaxID=383855 RepID=M3A193_PSEFD|nr:uncharacterized protein MYCFIDRAFT_200470 [Pseudocercospora fijiensis CIRAD86]EME78156.1 hypothetical protein MYCFIDRAFT_200470 [Pseudocercospora fijiensis CIRAD86]